jgi:hypothetical protein
MYALPTLVQALLEPRKVAMLDADLEVNYMVGGSTSDSLPPPRNKVSLLDLVGASCVRGYGRGLCHEGSDEKDRWQHDDS